KLETRFYGALGLLVVLGSTLVAILLGRLVSESLNLFRPVLFAGSLAIAVWLAIWWARVPRHLIAEGRLDGVSERLRNLRRELEIIRRRVPILSSLSARSEWERLSDKNLLRTWRRMTFGDWCGDCGPTCESCLVMP